MKTKTSLVLMLAGILTVAGGLKFSNHYIRKEKALKQSLPTRVYEINSELSRLEGLPAIKILSEVSDPNNQFIEDYKGLVKEWRSYDPNMITSVFKNVKKCESYQAVGGGVMATGICLTALGSTPISNSYLDKRRKRKLNK